MSIFSIVLCLIDTDEASFITSSPKLIERCQIVKLPNEVSYQRMLNTLSQIKKGAIKRNLSVLAEVLLGLRHLSEPKDMTKINFKDTSLNEYQKEAVRFALGSPELSLIHGPPGNRYFYAKINTDNLVERYIKHDTNVVRIGHPARVSPNVVRWTLDVLCSDIDVEKVSSIMQEELQKLSRKLRTVENISEGEERKKILETLKSLLKKKVTLKKKNEKINAANVVFSTLNASGPLKNKMFDVIIIDEVGQSTEPDCWIPLSKAKKAILSGDHLQLPPTVKTPPKITKNIVKSIFQGMSLMNDLSYTLFDRLLSMYGDKVKKLLSIQYRMHEQIMAFSSKELYNNKLIADSSVAQHILQDLPDVKKTAETCVPIIIIDTKDTNNHHESKGGKMNKQSTANDYEVKVIVCYIGKLLKDGLTQKDIAVITPYKAQVTKLLLAMGDKWIDIEVGTVDGFQGREKEAIILSLVRSNKRREVGFLAEKRRLNVAMTRARRHLVVVGDTVTLNGSEYDKNEENPFFIDRTFLENWIEWLNKNSEVRYSKAILK
ncbi:hypothetical protein INT48_001206, partial [Thamnidium elegans]